MERGQEHGVEGREETTRLAENTLPALWDISCLEETALLFLGREQAIQTPVLTFRGWGVRLREEGR